MSRKNLQSLMRSGPNVVGVKRLHVAIEAWSPDSFLPGDILEELKAEGVATAAAPFYGGTTALQKLLRKLAQPPNGISVRVRRGGKAVDIHARVVTETHLVRKPQCLLAAYHDPKYVCHLYDATEEECKIVQENTLSQMEKSKLQRQETDRDLRLKMLADTRLKDSNFPYRWKEKMEDPRTCMVFSLLLMPYQPQKLTSVYMDVEETSARAMAWLTAAQRSGVPIAFVNIQTEPFILQGPGFRATGLRKQDPETIANLGLYNVQPHDGLDIDILRAVRLWYVPALAELAVNLQPNPGEARLGLSIDRTPEGFCHVSAVDESMGTPAGRAGLSGLYQKALRANKQLVISRVGGVKVTPWFVDSSGDIRSCDTTTIRNKLRLHLQAGEPVQLHFILWEGRFDDLTSASTSAFVPEIVPPTAVQEIVPLGSQTADVDRCPLQAPLADEEPPTVTSCRVADSVVASGKGQLQQMVSLGPSESELVERPPGSNRFRVAPEPWATSSGLCDRFDENAESFRFEALDAGFHSEHPNSIPWMGSGHYSSPAFNSL